MWKDNIYFILVEPREPGNIGSSARALKNMGFKNLEMVNPAYYFTEETKRLACNAFDIIERAKVYATLTDALKDKSIVVGATRRTGRKRSLILPVKKCSEELVGFAGNNKIAVVFGREDRGLTNEEVGQCGYLTTIPSHTDQPSLNLAQAVIIVAYELSQLEPSGNAHRLVGRDAMAPLYPRISRLLETLGYIPGGDRDLESRIMMNIRRLFGRSGLTDWELNMLFGLCSRLEPGLKKTGEESG